MVGVRDGGEEVLGGVRREKMVMFLLPAGGAWHMVGLSQAREM